MWSIPTTHPTTVPHSNRNTVDAKPLRSHSHVQTTCHWKLFSATPTPARGHSTRIVSRWKTLRKKVTNAPPLSLTCRRVRAHCLFSGCQASSPESPTANLQVYMPGFLIQHLHHPLLSIFLSNGIYLQLLLDFSSSPTPLKLLLPFGVVLFLLKVPISLKVRLLIPMYLELKVTLDKVTGIEYDQSWADYVDLWFIGNGCEDHLTIVDTSILEDQHPQW